MLQKSLRIQQDILDRQERNCVRLEASVRGDSLIEHASSQYVLGRSVASTMNDPSILSLDRTMKEVK